jgi:prephenate dehydrogenase
VPDRPGEISKVLAVMGEAGINLEDLRIEHVPGRLVGLAEISVLPSARRRLEDVLVAGGWSLAG